ncbi:hypothetical protein N9133_00425 [Akkermansiaceae bacterium]|nr:hypothetical protein [Akkermansiaceae bacterium]MDB4457820.1 hypothetical protein [Akkermansiaceae bacterium]MDB4462288.1 hypothetical protein [bacterium]MDB4505084.1 hypothetical protein [Akkermansiaceae bacterium]MDB4546014.1 hypothetical protein [Akkermansiaceae bacterium]
MADKEEDHEEIEELPEFEELLDHADEEDSPADEPDADDELEEVDLVEEQSDEPEEKEPGENEEPQLRVIPEEEPAEVVRLEEVSESEPKDLSKKVKAREDRQFLNTMMSESSEADLDQKVVNTDEEWMKRVPAGNSTAVPMGWFVLVIGVMALIVSWAAYQLVFAEKEVVVDVDSNTPSGLEAPLGREVEEKERIEAASSYDALESQLGAYFSATTIEEKLKYVRHPERVEPLMRDYYSRHKIIPKEYKSIVEFHIVSLDNRPFTALSVETKDESKKLAVLVEKTSEGSKFDWESEVAYQPMSLDEFMEKRPTEAMDFRVYATADRYYAYEFQDEQKWLCYRLSERDGEGYLFGYFSREQEEVVGKVMGSLSPTRKITKPLLLRLRFRPNGKGPRSVLIEKVVAERWAYSTDP